jgi:two-component system CheB/CheR fusion protein
LKKNVDLQTESVSTFPVVALCGSAGGLAAFIEFFDTMPNASGMAFIIVQHLAVDHESMLTEIIQRRTPLAVNTIADNMPIEPDQVYVSPPGYLLQVEDGRLQLSALAKKAGSPHTIDVFLTSLANDMSKRAAAIIFSGAGTDALAGAHEIVRKGGLVIAQAVDTAGQSSMPAHVIDAGLAHSARPPADIPDLLLKVFHHDNPLSPLDKPADADLSDYDVNRVIQRVHEQMGYDFVDYKRSTLKRQLVRRMTICGMNRVNSYLAYMEREPLEAEILAKYLLINVTSFFRDPDAFETLKHKALLPTLRKLTTDTIFRAWIPGCSTGEEAVSIAILIYECLRELDKLDMEVRLFATDVDRDIIQQARTGLYPASIVKEISPERLREHFVAEDNGFRVRNHISRMIVCSIHNLAEHPPFSKQHFISCRNVLIYFQQPLQQRVVALFSFALRPGGILFIGTSETLSPSTEDFRTIDKKHKIYSRVAGKRGSWLQLDRPIFIKIPDFTETKMPDPELSNRATEDYELDVIKTKVLEYHQSTCIIVDQSYQVRYTYGEIDRYLRIVPGREVARNILELARERLGIELTVALNAIESQGTTIVRENVRVKTNGEERLVNLTVMPIEDKRFSDTYKLIIIEQVSGGPDLPDESLETADGKAQDVIRLLKTELQQTQRALQNVTQVLHTKDEELRSSMEEVRSAAEEVETTNEELRSSKEELESMNEELNTLNNQLTDQNYELTQANNTLHNFLQSTEIGMVFLDEKLTIKRYTVKATAIFGLRGGDEGRPLSEISHHLNYPDLLEDAKQVLNTLKTIEKEVSSRTGGWFLVRIQPYRTTSGDIDGLVLTFSDITAQKEAELQANKKSRYIREIFDTIDHSLLELDDKLRVLSVNQTFYDAFQVNESNTVGQLLYNLGNGQWDIPELRRLLTEIIPEQSVVHDYTVTHDFPDLGRRTMKLNARQIAELDRILLVITDVSAEPE